MLIVHMAAREVSIMRALGTTKKRTRVILALEQVFLCLLGLLCAAALLLIINGESLITYAAPLGLYAAVHFAASAACALTCAVIITHRRILELLQVKE